MEKVQILMSTFNGERYIKEQIDSIFNQNDVDVNILVRDDGSNDKTIEILKMYGDKLKFYTGKNLRSAKSFMDLINKSGDYEYFAFSDQDDFWKVDKLSKAVEKIKKLPQGTPALYFCDKEIVDENLNNIKHKKVQYKVGLGSAMIKNVATGCTIVVNKELMKYLKMYNPEYIEMHDSWAYRVCLAIGGSVIYDSDENIKYRQHSNNVIGARESWKHEVNRRWKSLTRCEHVREKTANELIKGFSKFMNEENLKIIQCFADYRKSHKNKMFILFNPKIKTENLKDNIIFKCALIMNKV